MNNAIADGKLRKQHRNGRAPTSRFPGVYWHKGGWCARIRAAGQRKLLGYFSIEEDAATAYALAKAARVNNAFTVADGIATMKLTQGLSMRVAEADLPLLTPHRWCALRGGRKRAVRGAACTYYAVTSVRRPDGRRKVILAHRLLTGLDFDDPREADHIDGDGLNNTPSNLRVTDRVGNVHNEHGKRRPGDCAPTSLFPGVCWDRERDKWYAKIGSEGRQINLGRFLIEEDAAEVYAHAKATRDAGGTLDEIRATVSQGSRRKEKNEKA